MKWKAKRSENSIFKNWNIFLHCPLETIEKLKPAAIDLKVNHCALAVWPKANHSVG